jgi:hypothetical protein
MLGADGLSGRMACRRCLQWYISYVRSITQVIGYVSSFLRFLDHTQRRATGGRSPLGEWSARRRDLYLRTHNTHNRQTSMPPRDSNPLAQQPQTYTLDRTVTRTGYIVIWKTKIEQYILDWESANWEVWGELQEEADVVCVSKKITTYTYSWNVNKRQDKAVQISVEENGW